ncbi:hypothetical protein [Cytobacillus solani]|uniref:Uncharacterized protein n=1 Tax=Cytobacillus solani TaxID=1637975 RepID=A0A0Q3VH75_9BACI|nr:hypothetical protein [Cytobacillus solani]KQL18823.1 hypothetical protein AN957_09725 [Cytobacillus solani]
MARLNVKKLSDKQIEYNGVIYAKASHPIQTGDIVLDNEDLGVNAAGGFYEVIQVNSYDDFTVIDDDSDDRERDTNDRDFVPYRKVTDADQPMTITLTQPVHLIIKNIATIEFKTE